MNHCYEKNLKMLEPWSRVCGEHFVSGDLILRLLVNSYNVVYTMLPLHLGKPVDTEGNVDYVSIQFTAVS